MKIYIAGPISKNPSYKEQFGAYQRELEARGHIVLNPARLPQGMMAGDYMRICFSMLEVADAVVFLPNYGESSGALLEMDWCAYVHKLQFYPPSLESLRRSGLVDCYEQA